MNIRLKYWRVRKGYSMPQLARKAGVSTSTIMRIEAGQDPYAHTVGKLANGLGITPEELVRDAESLQKIS